MAGVETGGIFLLFWVTYCNWKCMVRATVLVEERKISSSVKRRMCFILAYHTGKQQRKLAPVTETAWSSNDKTLRHTVSVLTRKERQRVLRILTILSAPKTKRDCQSFLFTGQCVYGSSEALKLPLCQLLTPCATPYCCFSFS